MVRLVARGRRAHPLIQPGTKCPGVRGPSSLSPTRLGANLLRGLSRTDSALATKISRADSADLSRADIPLRRSANLSRTRKVARPPTLNRQPLARGQVPGRRPLARGQQLSSATRRVASLSRARTVPWAHASIDLDAPLMKILKMFRIAHTTMCP